MIPCKKFATNLAFEKKRRRLYFEILLTFFVFEERKSIRLRLKNMGQKHNEKLQEHTKNHFAFFFQWELNFGMLFFHFGENFRRRVRSESELRGTVATVRGSAQIKLKFFINENVPRSARVRPLLNQTGINFFQLNLVKLIYLYQKLPKIFEENKIQYFHFLITNFCI
jgi:hypothetical protein